PTRPQSLRGRRTTGRAASEVGASASTDRLVARAADRANQAPPAELLAQLRDVDVHGAGAAGERHSPDPVEQALAREHEAGVLREVREQVELLRGQLDRRAVDGDRAARALDGDVSEPHGLVRGA